MWLVRLALRRPISVMVGVLALLLGGWLAARSAPADIFPTFDVPIIYVVQPYAGMAPSQMESQFVTYYEYHFLYVAGIEHIESQSIQGAALLKLYFWPGTDIAQSVAQVTAMAFRATSFMPPGTLPAFVLRFDAGSVPVGKLVFSGPGFSEAQIEDEAVYRTRPLLGTLPGVSAPPPFGGKVRTIVVDVAPDRMRAYGISPLDVVQAILKSNLTLPSGNVTVGDLSAIVQTNAMAREVSELGDVPLRLGPGPTVFIRDVGRVHDGTDILTQVALVNGRRTVYLPVVKRADASTLSVVDVVKRALPRMRALLPQGMNVNFEFDQSVYVRNAIRDLIFEGALGAALTGLMVLLFLANWRSALIVVITIPLSIVGAVVALRLTGKTINIMTLGGLALAVGILVDEATVAIENIHSHLARGVTIARAVADGMAEVVEPRFIAVVCIVAVLIPSFFMTGIGRTLFVPLSLAVAFAMAASYVVSTTVLPVLAVWFLGAGHDRQARPWREAGFERVRARYGRLVERLTGARRVVLGLYAAAVVLSLLAAGKLGVELFPRVDSGQFQLRIRAPSGTDLAHTERIVRRVERAIADEAGAANVALTLATIGVPNWQHPVNLVFLWNSGPQDAVLEVSLADSPGRPPLAGLETRLRKRFARDFPGVRFSLEAGDIVSQVLNYGSPTPVEVTVWGKSFAAMLPYVMRLRAALKRIPELRDVQIAEPLDYPTRNISINRTLAGQFGVTVEQIAGSVVDATATSVLISRNYWVDPQSGIPYPVEVRVPPRALAPAGALRQLPVMPIGAARPLLSDVATVSAGRTMGEIDHLNNQRSLNIVANIAGNDYGRAAAAVRRAIDALGAPPRGVTVESRGQLARMLDTLAGLRLGLLLSIVVIVLVLAANFESVRDAVAVLCTLPAVLAGVVLALLATGSTLNVESFMGAIMAVGVAVANALLLITFARDRRRQGAERPAAAIAQAARRRLRPILMTTLAMVAGMIPMASGFGAGGAAAAPLGRAVIGGLLGSLPATLLALPAIFLLLTPDRPMRSPSLDPDDPESSFAEGHR
jgi:multidrug efflux pump subunit AcrB